MTAATCRVILCTDAKNEADDPFAIAHGLLTERLEIRGIIAGHFGLENSTQQSYEEIIRLVNLTHTQDRFPIVLGAADKLEPSNPPTGAAAVRLLVEEAMREDSRPLFILCIGALTDLALALLAEPAIAQCATAIWVGGGRYPHGSPEANLNRDIAAANLVFASEIPLWQIPSNVYKTILAPVSDMTLRLKESHGLGSYLLQQLLEFSAAYTDSKAWINNECWVLGDSAAIGVLLDEQKGSYELLPAPCFNAEGTHDFSVNKQQRPIRVYHQINAPMILSDMYAKILLFDAATTKGDEA